MYAEWDIEDRRMSDSSNETNENRQGDNKKKLRFSGVNW